mgnify:FL=1
MSQSYELPDDATGPTGVTSVFVPPDPDNLADATRLIADLRDQMDEGDRLHTAKVSDLEKEVFRLKAKVVTTSRALRKVSSDLAILQEVHRVCVEGPLSYPGGMTYVDIAPPQSSNGWFAKFIAWFMGNYSGGR